MRPCNFAGGLRQDTCSAWERGLASGAASYAKETRLPSLWFYGDNDSYFKTDTYRAMFEQYTAAGGQARLVAFGKFGSDSHSMFGARADYKVYLTKQIPRAFAIALSGAWGWADVGDDPLLRALNNCNRYRKDKADCKLYSVDDFVVWKTE